MKVRRPGFNADPVLTSHLINCCLLASVQSSVKWVGKIYLTGCSHDLMKYQVDLVSRLAQSKCSVTINSLSSGGEMIVVLESLGSWQRVEKNVIGGSDEECENPQDTVSVLFFSSLWPSSQSLSSPRALAAPKSCLQIQIYLPKGYVHLNVLVLAQIQPADLTIYSSNSFSFDFLISIRGDILQVTQAVKPESSTPSQTSSPADFSFNSY